MSPLALSVRRKRVLNAASGRRSHTVAALRPTRFSSSSSSPSAAARVVFFLQVCHLTKRHVTVEYVPGDIKRKKKRKKKAGSKVMCAFHCTDYSLFLDKLYMCVYKFLFKKNKTKQMTMCMWPSHVKFLTVNTVNNYLMKEPTFPQRNKWGENIAALWPLIFVILFYFAQNEPFILPLTRSPRSEHCKFLVRLSS